MTPNRIRRATGQSVARPEHSLVRVTESRSTRTELNIKIAVESIGNSAQVLDVGRVAACLERCNGGLLDAEPVGKLLLCEPECLSALPDAATREATLWRGCH